MVEKVAISGKQYHSVEIPCICSDLPEEIEVFDRGSGPRPNVAAIHRYSKYWLWSKHVIWILKPNMKRKCGLMLDNRPKGSDGLYDNSSSDSSAVQCMVLKRVS